MKQNLQKSQPDIIKPLNENKLTQIFVEQIDIQLRRQILGVGVKNQYSDLFYGTKGIPDFYFHALEEGKTSLPLFICEAKRLPSPKGSGETEYVIGEKKNGGIERFKIEKHTKGFSEGGLIGFVETQTFEHWNSQVNSWIVETAKSNTDWSSDEVLTMTEDNSSWRYSNSIVHRKKTDSLKLHHFWIN